jgi:hypothetical protein
VFFIAPNKKEENIYLDILSDVVSTGLRKMFSVITEEGLMKDVSIQPINIILKSLQSYCRAGG